MSRVLPIKIWEDAFSGPSDSISRREGGCSHICRVQGQDMGGFAGREEEVRKGGHAEKEKERQRMLRRSRSAVELRGLGGGLARHGSTPDLQQQGEYPCTSTLARGSSSTHGGEKM